MHALVSNKQEGPAQILTYILFNTQGILLSATSRKGQPDPDLPPVQHQVCSCQQQAGQASQVLTYNLFDTKSMLLSATSRKGQPDPDLLAVQSQEHALISNKQEGTARS